MASLFTNVAFKPVTQNAQLKFLVSVDNGYLFPPGEPSALNIKQPEQPGESAYRLNFAIKEICFNLVTAVNKIGASTNTSKIHTIQNKITTDNRFILLIVNLIVLSCKLYKACCLMS